jgi:hypothetical protein
MLSGTVTVNSSNLDSASVLVASPNGIWSGQWVPNHYWSQVTASLTATQPDLNLSATETTNVSLANTDAPLVTAAGVVSAASGSAELAPGAAISIYGSALALGITSFAGLPLGTSLGGTKVLLNTEKLPLIFTSALQINAVLPYDLAALQTVFADRAER